MQNNLREKWIGKCATIEKIPVLHSVPYLLRMKHGMKHGKKEIQLSPPDCWKAGNFFTGKETYIRQVYLCSSPATDLELVTWESEPNVGIRIVDPNNESQW